jgi:hypothetical protein
MCKICTHVTPNEPQITLGRKEDKSFTYDYVYDIDSKQENIFNASVKYLVDGCLNGYNATVIAYGQTGSGKTYTMGTSFDEINFRMEEEGILPRAIAYLFDQIEKKKAAADKANNPTEFVINAQFIELYNEEIIDLIENQSNSICTPRFNQLNESLQDYMINSSLNMSSTPCSTNSTANFKSKIEIHEDQFGGIFINGCSNKNVNSVDEV